MRYFMRIRDKDNNIVEIPLEGIPGKSAYNYAKEAGYTGSETEFSNKLANKEIYYGDDEEMPNDCTMQLYYNPEEDNEEDEKTAKDGMSAYEIACDHGFEGTEDEWLESLKGEKGETGKSAYTYAIDGGYTGTEEEFAERMAFLMSGAVVGYVDGSTIVLSGDLANGTYTAYYELVDDDGNKTLVDIGELALVEKEMPATYTVTFVADSTIVATVAYKAGATSIEEPAVPAKDGYTGAWESYTLNNTNITVNAVYTGSIEAQPINWIPISTDIDGNAFGTNGILSGKRLSLTDGSESVQAEYSVTGFIPVQYGDEIYIENIAVVEHNWENICFFKSDKSKLASSGNTATTLQRTFVTVGEVFDNGYLSTLNSTLLNIITTDLAYIRIGSKGLNSNSILRIRRNGEWLVE